MDNSNTAPIEVMVDFFTKRDKGLPDDLCEWGVKLVRGIRRRVAGPSPKQLAALKKEYVRIMTYDPIAAQKEKQARIECDKLLFGDDALNHTWAERLQALKSKPVSEPAPYVPTAPHYHSNGWGSKE